jgi:hypothetical protein
MVRLTTEEINAFITKFVYLEHFSMFDHYYRNFGGHPHRINVASIVSQNFLLQTFNVCKICLIAASKKEALREGFQLTCNPNL